MSAGDRRRLDLEVSRRIQIRLDGSRNSIVAIVAAVVLLVAELRQRQHLALVWLRSKSRSTRGVPGAVHIVRRSRSDSRPGREYRCPAATVRELGLSPPERWPIPALKFLIAVAASFLFNAASAIAPSNTGVALRLQLGEVCIAHIRRLVVTASPFWAKSAALSNAACFAVGSVAGPRLFAEVNLKGQRPQVVRIDLQQPVRRIQSLRRIERAVRQHQLLQHGRLHRRLRISRQISLKRRRLGLRRRLADRIVIGLVFRRRQLYAATRGLRVGTKIDLGLCYKRYPQHLPC